MTRAYLAFTDTGLALARRLADALPGSVDRCGSDGVSLAGWTALQFAQSDALVFVGAVGIAVRAIAPHCRSKASDPAVVVLDECGRFAVPVLSGHLGGANDLARALAAVCGAVPVITTATDAHGIFAVDEWAKHQNCTVLEAERIKHVSSKLLAGQSVRFAAEFPVQGTPPAGVDPARTPAEVDFALTLSPAGDALHLVPRIGVLGIGSSTYDNVGWIQDTSDIGTSNTKVLREMTVNNQSQLISIFSKIKDCLSCNFFTIINETFQGRISCVFISITAG